MVFCRKCGEEISEKDNFCKNCGLNRNEELKEDFIYIEDPRIKEKEIVNGSSIKNLGKFLAVLLSIIIIIGVIVFILIIVSEGSIDSKSRGSGIPYVDPCERQFNQCNKECGEGILSGICKEKCSSDYRRCRN